MRKVTKSVLLCLVLAVVLGLILKPENVNALLNVDPIELEFGYGIIPLADVNQGGDLLDRVVMIRRQIAI